MYASKKILDYRKKENHFNGCLFTYGGRSAGDKKKSFSR